MAIRNLLYDSGSSTPVLCDNLRGVGNGREVQEGGDMCILMLIHGDVWQKPTQYCKAIILQ